MRNTQVISLMGTGGSSPSRYGQEVRSDKQEVNVWRLTEKRTGLSLEKLPRHEVVGPIEKVVAAKPRGQETYTIMR